MTRFLPATAALELQKAEMSEVYIAVEDAFGKDATIELIGTYAEAVRMAPAFRKPDADTVLLLDARLPPNAQTSYDGEQSAALAILGQRLNGAPATIVLTPKLVIDEIVDFCRPGSGAIALPLHRLNASTLGGFVKMLLPTPQPTWNVIEIEVSERSTKCILVTRNGGQMEWNEGRPASSRAVQRMSMKYKTPKFAVGWARQFHDDGFTLFTELVRDTLGSGFYRHLASAAGGLENLAFRFRVDDLRLYSAPFEAAVWPSDQPFSGTENDFADNPFVLVNAPIARRMKRDPIRRTTAFDTLPPRPRLLFVSPQVGANPAAPTGVDTVGVQEIDPETGRIRVLYREFRRLDNIDNELAALRDLSRDDTVFELILLDLARPHAAGAEALLKERLAEGNYDVVHFAGHSLTTGDNLTLLILPGQEPGVAEAVAVETFAESAAKAGTRLVYLSSCEGSSANTVASLGQRGVPHVLGFRCNVEDQRAAAFAKLFYERLFSLGARQSAARSGPHARAFMTRVRSKPRRSGRPRSWPPSPTTG